MLRHVTGIAGEPAPHVTMTGEALTVVVVDDDEQARRMLCGLIAACGEPVEIGEVPGPLELLELVGTRKVDCVVLGPSMMGAAGAARLRELRDAGVTVPVLAVLGDSDEAGVRPVAAGAADFLSLGELTATRLLQRMRDAVRVGRAEADARTAQRELAAERGARQLAVLARDQDLAIVAHELRNPLNAISIAVHDLSDAKLDEVTRTRNVHAIVRALARAERQICDLLDANRIDEGTLVVEPRSIAVTAVFDLVASRHTVAARTAGTPLELSIHAGVDRVLADRDRLLQVLDSLIGNAMRHARTTGAIRLSAASDGDRVEFTVDDHGPGIAAEALPHLFDRYWQASRKRSGGAGLGLTIAQAIVAGHGGVITAGRAPGGGARFRFTLARP